MLLLLHSKCIKINKRKAKMSINYTCAGCNKKFYGKPIEKSGAFYSTSYMGQLQQKSRITHKLCSNNCFAKIVIETQRFNAIRFTEAIEQSMTVLKATYASQLTLKNPETENTKQLLRHVIACKKYFTDKISKAKYQEITSDVIEYFTEHNEDSSLNIVCMLNSRLLAIY